MPDLCFGGISTTQNESQIDSMSRSTGLFTTLFVLSEEAEPSFYRITTSLRRSNGQRAVGTQLNPRGNAAQKLLNGQATYGYVYTLGLPFLCAYAPILDAAGKIIGAACTGTSVKDANNPLLLAARGVTYKRSCLSPGLLREVLPWLDRKTVSFLCKGTVSGRLSLLRMSGPRSAMSKPRSGEWLRRCGAR